MNLNRYCTLDLDNYSNDDLHRIVAKLLQLQCCEGCCVKPSSKKGYHVLIWCRDYRCDLCRVVFDDPIRYSLDFERSWIYRNILWDTKIQYRKKSFAKEESSESRVAGANKQASKGEPFPQREKVRLAV